MKDDAELLRSYVRDRSEEAFSELVRRHLGLVYSGALRRAGHDAHLAEDIAQKVFSDLARKAPVLVGRTSLSGWLYVSTHHAAAEAVRKERRRKTREAEAHTMERILSTPSEPEIDWDRLRPLLDDLVLELKDEDREAVVLRFFEQRSLAEIGTTLRLTEDAARKRIERAVEKLRARLAERGVTSTTGVVAFVLADQAVSAAPVALATKIAGAALLQLGAVGAGTPLILSILNALTSNTAIVGAGLAALIASLGWQNRVQTGLQAEIMQLSGQTEAIRTLRQENQRLSRSLSAVDDLRRLEASLPVSTPAPTREAPSVLIKGTAAPLNVVITSKGSLLWEGKPVPLGEFLARLNGFHTQNPGPEANILVRAEDGASFSQATFVTDEARKTEIKGIVVESTAKPEPEMNWFRVSPPGAPSAMANRPDEGERKPPSLPERSR